MPENSISLEKLRVAAPCPIAWESMAGDDHIRFCSQCQLNVYSLSSLTRAVQQSNCSPRLKEGFAVAFTGDRSNDAVGWSNQHGRVVDVH